MAEHFETVDEYIASQPGEVQVILQEIRRRALAAVPGAWKHPISVSPVPNGDEEFEQEIAPYRAAKGTLKFPLGKPMPYELIEKWPHFSPNGSGAGTRAEQVLGPTFSDTQADRMPVTIDLHGSTLRVCRPST
jgi:uncharacterized protein YdhG (YjbR/CyaY superfamily)